VAHPAEIRFSSLVLILMPMIRLLCHYLPGHGVRRIGVVGLLSLVAGAMAASQVAGSLGPGPNETPSQETTAQEAAAQEATAQETAAQETAAQETAAQETAAQEVPAQDVGRARSENFLPHSTRAWVSISSLTDLEVALYETQMGQLAHDPDLAPVVESFSNQITDWLDNRNVKFALNMEKLGKLNSGEVCFAAVLNQEEGQDAATKHAIVVMVDVLGHEADYQFLMSEVENDLKLRGATRSEVQVLEQTVVRWEFQKPRGIAIRENVFFARVADRLIACDELSILAEVMSAVLSPEPSQAVLARHEPFVQVRQRCQRAELNWNPQIRWFIEPFGYVELTDLLAKRNRASRLDPNAREPKEIAAILRRQGFGATKAVGGDLVFNHQGLEMMHRSFIYAPGNADDGPRFEKAAQMLDFPNPGSEVSWESWVPDHAATAATIHWNFAQGVDSIGLLVDEFTKEGNWETMIEGWNAGRQGIKFDLYGIAARMDGKITFLSDFEEPIEEGSERMVVGLKIAARDDNESWVAKELDGFFKPQKNAWKPLPHTGGLTIWKAERIEEPEDDLGIDDLDRLLGDTPPQEAAVEKDPPLFPEQYVMVARGNILFANDLNFLKKIVDSAAVPLTDNSDFKIIAEKLDQLSPASDSMRQFGRVDRSVKFIYELLRKNKVPRDNSLLARMLKEMQDGEITRKVDGSKLPQDFENVVAPHLGISGWSLETEADGWFFVGVIMAKSKLSASAAVVAPQDR
jgi:hypothetical protein